jgi:hypothetical protein
LAECFYTLLLVSRISWKLVGDSEKLTTGRFLSAVSANTDRPAMSLANEVTVHPALEEWDALAANLANLCLERLHISSDSESDEPREGEIQGNVALEKCREVGRRIGTSAHR